jgi:hypothetical protein
MPVYTFLDTWVQDDGKGIIFAVEPKSDPAGRTAATLQPIGQTERPEIIAVRELLTIGGTLRPPRPSR